MPRTGWVAAGGLAVALAGAYGPVTGETAWLVAASAVIVAAPAVVGRRPVLAVALLAAALVAARSALVAPEPVPTVVPDTSAWIATVAEVRAPADGRQRAVLVADPENAEGPPLRLWATLPRYPAVAPGDRVRFSAEAEPPPTGTPFGEYLRASGIAGTVLVREMLPAGSQRSRIDAVRGASGDALAAVLPEPQAGLAAGIVVGLRERVDRTVADTFAVAGLSHVVAISGWNIALVAACLAAVLRPLPRRTRSLAIVVAVCAYTVFAGASPSVVRAALMAAVVLIARESGRRGAAAAALGLAAYAMLLVDPATVRDAGYQLSVAATGGLLVWGPWFTAAIRRRVPATPAWIAETLGVSLAAQLATLPIVLLAFGRLSLVAPLANLVAAPLVAPAMLIGVLALLVGLLVEAGAPAFLALPITTAGWAAFGSLIATGHVAAAVPLASVELTEPWNAIAAALAGLVVVLAAAASRPRAGVRSRLARTA